MKKSQEIRQDFLDFFRKKGHKIVASAPVIPFNDQTLLFTNAGMNQFKDVFLGTGKRDYTRCANTQKCIRVSGKHNDLEEVGHDGYHHTFFEMLGNWSFGDYYKKEAITWAWELLTEVWQMPKERLWASVYKDDEESFNLWKNETDIINSHVLKFGEKENFWEMGETGPCGPCSEIHIDLTQEGCKAEDINAGNSDVIEFWNLVFIQYNRDENGVLHELPAKHVDTGLGLERLVRILQNKNSNYETDIFQPIINELINITGKEYSGYKNISAMNVIADHVRALTFAIADGALPSNEGRGYVLRRILRRAARYGRNLNMHKPFIYNLVRILTDTMGSVFPEIAEKKDFIEDVIKSEEESFNETLDRGLVYFNEEVEKMKITGSKVFSGEVAFKLHDTYGFPVDLTQLMARELEYTVDVDKFEELMNEQKDRARRATSSYIFEGESEVFEKAGDFAELLEGKYKQEYNPYEIDEKGINTKIVHLHEIMGSGNSVCVLKYNPFYAESGGQVSDKGEIILPNNQIAKVIDSKKDYIIVNGVFDNSYVLADVVVRVNYPRRLSIQRNHSATHLVHEALRQVLGSHVKQMGSYLDDKLLRFDFPHFHKLTEEQIKEIEELVNYKISENIPVHWEYMPYDKANKIPNIKKYFGEKYGDEVRVVFIDERFSVELCGGTHVKDTSDIGLFKIIKEESVSSGIRRIFARTGEGILTYLDEKINEIEKLISDLPEKYTLNFKSGIENYKSDVKSADFRDAETLKKLLRYNDSTISSLYELREKYLQEKKQADKQLAKKKVEAVINSIPKEIQNAQFIDGLKILSLKCDVDNVDELKEVGDAMRVRLSSGIVLLYSIIGNKVNLVIVITDDLIKAKGLNAGEIIRELAKLIGGGGGGKPHMATAGGKDVSKIDEMLKSFPIIVKKYI